MESKNRKDFREHFDNVIKEWNDYFDEVEERIDMYINRITMQISNFEKIEQGKYKRLRDGQIFRTPHTENKTEVIQHLIDANAGIICINKNIYIGFTLLEHEGNLEEGFFILKDGKDYLEIGNNVQEILMKYVD